MFGNSVILLMLLLYDHRWEVVIDDLFGFDQVSIGG